MQVLLVSFKMHPSPERQIGFTTNLVTAFTCYVEHVEPLDNKINRFVTVSNQNKFKAFPRFSFVKRGNRI